MANEQLKQLIRDFGLKQWRVAEQYPMREDAFSKMLRHDLSDRDKIRAVAMVYRAKAERDRELAAKASTTEANKEGE